MIVIIIIIMIIIMIMIIINMNMNKYTTEFFLFTIHRLKFKHEKVKKDLKPKWHKKTKYFK